MAKKITIIFILIVLAIGAVVYVKQSRPTVPQQPLASSSKGAGLIGGSTNAAPASSFSNLLSTIKNIEIDTSIFSNEAYKTLRDYPVLLGTDVIGRSNPFAPIGIDSDRGAAQVQFETLQPGKVTGTTAEFGAQATVGGSTLQSNVVFEYGTSDFFGSATPPVVLPKNGTVLYTQTGLLPQTTYYVRAVLAVGSTTTLGNTMTFTTGAPR